jgi:hypothetical protein
MGITLWPCACHKVGSPRKKTRSAEWAIFSVQLVNLDQCHTPVGAGGQSVGVGPGPCNRLNKPRHIPMAVKGTQQTQTTLNQDWIDSNLTMLGFRLMDPRAAAGRQGGRAAGRQGGRAAGRQGDRAAGRQGSRAAGRQGSRAAGWQGSRAAGRQGGRAAGRQGGRAAGRQGGRAAGRQGGRVVRGQKILFGASKEEQFNKQ